jgi:hypothetical protein
MNIRPEIIINKNKGMSLAEVVIASAVILLVFVVLLRTNSVYYQTAVGAEKSVKATFLLEEGLEAVNYLSRSDWNNFPSPSPTVYYLNWSGVSWLATTTSLSIDNTYVRNFVIDSVNRDSNDDIVLAGGLPDQNTKKITMSALWSENGNIVTKSISAYILKP